MSQKRPANKPAKVIHYGNSSDYNHSPFDPFSDVLPWLRSSGRKHDEHKTPNKKRISKPTKGRAANL